MWYTFCAKPMILIDRIVTLRSRSPCGERGLKCIRRRHPLPRESRSPCGERGLKWEVGKVCTSAGSRSPCGERGLKYIRQNHRNKCAGRSPCGERGLKCNLLKNLVKLCLSLPVRGAWIEMNIVRSHPAQACWSLPVRGAWIEINQERMVLPCIRSLPVRGAWIEISGVAVPGAGSAVAPRAGSVD